MAENRISEEGVLFLQPHLRPTLLEIDLSSNCIGIKGCTMLSNFLLMTECRLVKVGLPAAAATTHAAALASFLSAIDWHVRGTS